MVEYHYNNKRRGILQTIRQRTSYILHKQI